MAEIYVTVDERCAPDGSVTPLSVVWQQREYKIDKVLDRRRDVIRKTGTIAMRYLVEIQGQRRYLYRDAGNRWLLVSVERPKPSPGAKGRHCCRDLQEMGK